MTAMFVGFSCFVLRIDGMSDSQALEHYKLA